VAGRAGSSKPGGRAAVLCQGSPAGRTLLMGPVMAAAAALTGKVTDARKLFHLESKG